MNSLIELREHEVQMVAGGGIVGNIAVQTNVSVTPQVAIALAVLSPHSYVSAHNNAFTIQLNLAFSV